MATVIHKTTLELRRSVNTPEFPEATWKRNPDLSAVAGVPRKYWKAPVNWDAPGAGPVEMNPAEKAAADVAETEAARDAVATQLEHTEDILRAFMLLVLEQINALRQLHGLNQFTETQLRNAIRNKLGT